MNLKTTRTVLAPEITGLDVRTDKFKTKRVSFTFLLPLTLEDTAIASLLARLLTRSTAQYPTPVELNRKLLSLYGALFSSQVIKLADHQLLNCSITVVEDRFALDHEPLTREAVAFLCDAIFNPHLEGDAFPADDVEICRRLLIESIESTINDKRKYAISKMYGLMCANEPFGIEIGGDLDTAARITGEQIAAYWRHMLLTAPVQITVVGQSDPAPVFDAVLRRWNTLPRRPEPVRPAFMYKPVEKVREETESMNVAQGKLVMGFRSDISTLEQNNMPLRLMCDIFGGAPYSKLFTIVREKMSLCYYCAARLQSQKGFLCVDSGVDNRNVNAAKEGILAQLEAMRQGDFDRQVIEASKMSMADGARSVTDSQEAIEAWYLARLFDHEIEDPQDWIRRLQTVEKEDIVRAARSVTLDTVYTLAAREEQP